MIVAVPFCIKDGNLAVKNLNFCAYIDGQVPVDALLTYDDQTPKEMVDRVRIAARKYFREVKEHQYYAPSTNGWPQAANHAFQSTARYISTEIREPFFWWEADAIPLRKGWLSDIAAEYEKAVANNKCFMGHLVIGILPGGHMNGVGVYPADVGAYSRNAMLANNSAWDVCMASQMLGHFWQANHLFQHCWAIDGAGNPTNATGRIPSFANWDDICNGPHRADFRCAIYHRCKDGSFIDHYLAKVAASAVPNHLSEAKVLEKMSKIGKKHTGGHKPKAKAVGCRILIVSYYRDFPWLKYCLQAIAKFGSGFDGVTVCIPAKDLPDYNTFVGAYDVAKVLTFHEREGKGMLHHMERMATADELVGKSKYVLHFDSDTIAREPFSPEDYIEDSRPIYVVRTYASLIEKNLEFPDRPGVISDCYQWKRVAERALGEETTMYTMCRHPTCFPVGFYKPFREHIAKIHGVPFEDFVLAQENKFPQGFADFPTMGAWAWGHMHPAFEWIDIAHHPVPHEKTKTYWSHGGLKTLMPSGKTAEQEIQELLKS